MRYINREQALNHVIPKDAEIIEDTVVFKHHGEICVIRVFAVENNCEDCADMWTTMAVELK